jgi:hypothetical protein
VVAAEGSSSSAPGNSDGRLQRFFVDKWRQNGFNQNHNPTAFHANIMAMEQRPLDIENVADDYGYCAQCGASEIRCPNTLVGDFYQARTETVKVVWAALALMVDKGLDPAGWTLWTRLTNELKGESDLGTDGGEPNGQKRVRDWAKGLDIRVGSEDVIFVDCEAAFDLTGNACTTAQALHIADWRASVVNRVIVIEPRPDQGRRQQNISGWDTLRIAERRNDLNCIREHFADGTPAAELDSNWSQDRASRAVPPPGTRSRLLSDSAGPSSPTDTTAGRHDI